MLKDFRCGHCKKLLARMGKNAELQIKCSRCGTLNHVKASELRVNADERTARAIDRAITAQTHQRGHKDETL
ncbi:Com family DNA-binding transcriptional regulator [Pseudomonas citrulli]|uniref:Com family DNA-binding transcriptional regulator n=1 Tax=Pseudomonas citrulli TaxID=3064347 RepID=A0ABT9C276_9PSED|nr:Com family DNA-binding transcriptional regulator [Pseudomonas sp. K18]MDO7898892.1 Com family DNA-binding transcriptional regulator [Pseudomonas sp. K18]